MGSKKSNGAAARTKQQIDDKKEYSSFLVVFFYCSLIVFLPVVTFFVLKSTVLDRFFTLNEVTTNIYSAVGAVVALHMALGLYVYRAYFSNGTTQATYKKID